MKPLHLLIWPLAFLFTIMALPAFAAMYDMPPAGSNVIGQTQHIKTRASDTFIELAAKYDLGYMELRAANPDVDPWLPGDGTPLVLPTSYILPAVKHQGIVINLAEMRIYYFPPKGGKYAGKVFTFPIGIGREGWSTPIMHTKIIQKIDHPSWTPPASIRKEHAEKGDPLPTVVPAGPDNPLGQHALRLGLPSYLIHGTNKPAGIGMRVSHGCIRLFPKDIAKLFSLVSDGTPVNIIDVPTKIGWQGDTLMLEAHALEPADDSKEKKPGKDNTSWTKLLVSATKDDPNAPINWKSAQQTMHQKSGVPTAIGSRSGNAAQQAGAASNDDDADSEDQLLF